MAGISIPVLRRSSFVLPTVAPTTTVTMPPLAQLIDTVAWVSGALIVRLWAQSLPNATAVVRIVVANTMVADDDPSIVFVGNTIATAQITDALQPTTLQVELLPIPIFGQPPIIQAIGRYVGVFMHLDGGASGLSGAVTLAVDLVGRDRG